MRQAPIPATPAPAAPAAASPPPTLQAEQPQPAASPADEDPFALFGSPPAGGSKAQLHAGSSPAAAAALPVTDIDDGFLAAFAAPQPQPQDTQQQRRQQQQQQQQRRQQQQQQQQAPAATPASPPLSAGGAADFGDFFGSEEVEVEMPVPARSSPPQQAARSQPPAGAAGPTPGYGHDRSAAAAAPPASAVRPRYRVFDFVHAEEDEGPAAGAGRPPTQNGGGSGGCGGGGGDGGPLEQGLRGGGGGGVLAAESYAGQHPGGAKDVAADLSQRAAKAFQSGTKWFMKASKTLAAQVQSRLEAGGGAGGGTGGFPRPGPSTPACCRPRACGCLVLPVHCAGPALSGKLHASQPLASTQPAASPPNATRAAPPPAAPGDPEPFHRDWAAQLARISPPSRAAALGAMAEDDRLAVQVGGRFGEGQLVSVGGRESLRCGEAGMEGNERRRRPADWILESLGGASQETDGRCKSPCIPFMPARLPAAACGIWPSV
jgi:type II secretory pathway pseudopilin PulG